MSSLVGIFLSIIKSTRLFKNSQTNVFGLFPWGTMVYFQINAKMTTFNCFSSCFNHYVMQYKAKFNTFQI